MLELWLIRHGKTEGNKYNRYIGTTDEPLCPEGQAFLSTIEEYPAPEAVYVSPMKRAVETAQILFPGERLHIVEELSECDFGEFENRNYEELSGNTNYQRWIDSGGTLPFPGGESREAFRERSIRGLEKVVSGCIRQKLSRAAVVAHGGTIMNIMEAYGSPSRSFYEWHVKNGGGYGVSLDEGLWQAGRRELVLHTAFMEG